MDAVQLGAIAAATAQAALNDILTAQHLAVARFITKRRRQRKRTRRRQELGLVAEVARRSSFEELTSKWSDKRFKRKLRLSREAFNYVLGVVGPKLEPSARGGGGGAKGHAAPPIAPAIKLAIALSLLRGQPAQDMDQWGVESDGSVVDGCFWPVVAAIHASPEFDMRLMPALEAAYEGRTEELEAITRRFDVMGGGVLPGCCGALDGYLPEINKPPVDDDMSTEHPRRHHVRNSRHYMSYKEYYAVNVQAVAGANREFLYASVRSPGSTPDAAAFPATSLARLIDAHRGLPGEGRFLLADDAYKADESTVTPYPGCDETLELDKSNFNHIQSSMRMPIECAFGRLVGMWGVLWRPLRMGLDHVPDLLLAAMKLCNVALRMPGVGDEPGDAEPQWALERLRAAGRFQPGRPLGERLRDIAWLRDQLRDRATEAGYMRPGGVRA